MHDVCMCFISLTCWRANYTTYRLTNYIIVYLVTKFNSIWKIGACMFQLKQ